MGGYMNVTELIEKLMILQNEGHGDKEVVIFDHEWSELWSIGTPAYKAEDNKVIIDQKD